MTAPKDTQGKDKMSLLPMDIYREFVILAYEEGLLNHWRDSWREGFPISDMYEALERHMERFFYHKEDLDPVSVELGIQKTHLAAIIFCASTMLHTLKYHPEMDDRPIKEGKHKHSKKENKDTEKISIDKFTLKECITLIQEIFMYPDIKEHNTKLPWKPNNKNIIEGGCA